MYGVVYVFIILIKVKNCLENIDDAEQRLEMGGNEYVTYVIKY